jgi:large subunit ribosomal protein L30
MSELLVTQRRSRNGANRRQLDTLRSLGLRRIGHSVTVRDTAAARGMLHAVRHLVSVEDPAVGDGSSTATASAR